MSEHDDDLTTMDVSIDTSAARQAVQELRADAAALDDELLQLKEDARQAFNATFEGRRKPAASYEEVQQRTRFYDPGLYGEDHPEVARATQAIKARQAVLDRQVTRFAQSAPDAFGAGAGGGPGGAGSGGRYQAFTRWAEQHPPPALPAGTATSVPGASPSRGTAPGQSGGAQERSRASAGSLADRLEVTLSDTAASRMGRAIADATPRFARVGLQAASNEMGLGPMGRAGVQSLIEVITSLLPPPDRTQQAGRGGSPTAAGAHAIAGALQGGLTAEAEGATAGSAAEGAAASAGTATEGAAAGTAGGFLANVPLVGGILALLGAAVGVGLTEDKVRASLYGDEEQLSATTRPGPGYQGAMDQVLTNDQIGKDFSVHPQVAQAVAVALGQSGIRGGDEMTRALKDTLALAADARLAPTQVAALTGSLYQGGMSTQAIGRSYQDLTEAAAASGTQLDKLIQSFGDLAQAAGNVQLNVAGVTAATQFVTNSVGQGANVGALVGGTMSTTGVSRMAEAAILGVPESQIRAAQTSSDPAKALSLAAGFAQRMSKQGLSLDVIETLLDKTGILNLSHAGLSAAQQDKLTTDLITKGPQAVLQDEKRIQAAVKKADKATPHDAWQGDAARAAEHMTTKMQEASIAIETAGRRVVKAFQDVADADPRKTGTVSELTIPPFTAPHVRADWFRHTSTLLHPSDQERVQTHNTARLNAALMDGLSVSNGHGGQTYVPADVMRQARQYAVRHTTPFAQSLEIVGTQRGLTLAPVSGLPSWFDHVPGLPTTPHSGHSAPGRHSGHSAPPTDTGPHGGHGARASSLSHEQIARVLGQAGLDARVPGPEDHGGTSGAGGPTRVSAGATTAFDSLQRTTAQTTTTVDAFGRSLDTSSHQVIAALRYLTDALLSSHARTLRVDPTSFVGASRTAAAAGATPPTLVSAPGPGPGPGTPVHGPLRVSNTRGATDTLSPRLLTLYQAASKATGVPVGVLAAQGARESDFQTGAISADGGYGIAQWTNPDAARHYMHITPGEDWRQVALSDPGRAIQGQAEYMRDLVAREHGNMQLALRDYNGSGPAAEAYGAAVYGAAQEVQHQLQIEVVVKDQQTGRQVAGSHTTHRIGGPGTHVNPHRTPVGHQTHGPHPSHAHTRHYGAGH